MQCPRCQAQNREGRRFCGECGGLLALPCPTCGFSNEPGEKFCGGCGLTLTPSDRPPNSALRAPYAYTPSYLVDKILTQKSTLEGERKQVTVLFADLKDSTELIRGVDPEGAQRLLDPALHHMMDAVHRFEGTVNQVLGDGIMALFGAPIAHEDHAIRACYAALAMQAAMRTYTEEVRRAHGLEMRMRVGLNSGEVVVRAIGNDLHMDYSAVGETTHLAARMEQLATPGSIRLDPSQKRQRTLTALKRVMLRESQAQPLLFVFEDLHWIDSETQVLLDSLIESLPMARLLLLVNYRPEYQHGWGAKTYYTQVRLDPLPFVSAEELLQVLLGSDPGIVPLKQLLIGRTEGNPFFLEESVRALVETGILDGEPGAYRLVPQVAAAPHGRPEVGNHREVPPPIDIQVPATVQAVLAARIDRLPPEEKRLLQTAAVIGNEVPFPLLQTIAELPEEALRRGLAHLQAAEFLYETRLFPEQDYTFTHALTHEVVYGSLLQERRRVLHSRLVEALEALAPERVAEQMERLAHHALRGEVWDKSVTYCQQAGARANDRAAFREAVGYFDQALQALAHPSEPGDTRVLALGLRLNLVDVLFVLGEYGRDLALLGEAPALARALDDQARLGQVLVQMVRVLRITGDPDGAMAAGQQALALAAEFGDSALQAEVSYTLAQAYWAIGDFGQAAELLQRSVEAADRESSRPSTEDLRIRSRAWLARILSALGAFAEGRRYGEEALRLATLAGRGVTPIIAHACLGHLSLTKGDLEHAIWVLEQGLALCRASGNRNWLPQTVTGLGSASALQGRLDEGRALLEEAINESIRTGGLQGQAYRVAWLSEVWRLSGHGEEAWQHARQALDLARQQKDRGDESVALHQLGIVHAHADPPDVEQAEAFYQQALSLAEELGMRPLQAHCHLGLGKLYTKIGRHEQARAELSTAIELYRALEMTFWLPQAEAALEEAVGIELTGKGDT